MLRLFCLLSLLLLLFVNMLNRSGGMIAGAVVMIVLGIASCLFAAGNCLHVLIYWGMQKKGKRPATSLDNDGSL